MRVGAFRTLLALSAFIADFLDRLPPQPGSEVLLVPPIQNYGNDNLEHAERLTDVAGDLVARVIPESEIEVGGCSSVEDRSDRLDRIWYALGSLFYISETVSAVLFVRWLWHQRAMATRVKSGTLQGDEGTTQRSRDVGSQTEQDREYEALLKELADACEEKTQLQNDLQREAAAASEVESELAEIEAQLPVLHLRVVQSQQDKKQREKIIAQQAEELKEAAETLMRRTGDKHLFPWNHKNSTRDDAALRCIDFASNESDTHRSDCDDSDDSSCDSFDELDYSRPRPSSQCNNSSVDSLPSPELFIARKTGVAQPAYLLAASS